MLSYCTEQSQVTKSYNILDAKQTEKKNEIGTVFFDKKKKKVLQRSCWFNNQNHLIFCVCTHHVNATEFPFTMCTLGKISPCLFHTKKCDSEFPVGYASLTFDSNIPGMIMEQPKKMYNFCTSKN